MPKQMETNRNRLKYMEISRNKWKYVEIDGDREERIAESGQRIENRGRMRENRIQRTEKENIGLKIMISSFLNILC